MPTKQLKEKSVKWHKLTIKTMHPGKKCRRWFFISLTWYWRTVSSPQTSITVGAWSTVISQSRRYCTSQKASHISRAVTLGTLWTAWKTIMNKSLISQFFTFMHPVHPIFCRPPSSFHPPNQRFANSKLHLPSHYLNRGLCNRSCNQQSIHPLNHQPTHSPV